MLDGLSLSQDDLGDTDPTVVGPGSTRANRPTASSGAAGPRNGRVRARDMEDGTQAVI